MWNSVFFWFRVELDVELGSLEVLWLNSHFFIDKAVLWDLLSHLNLIQASSMATTINCIYSVTVSRTELLHMLDRIAI